MCNYENWVSKESLIFYINGLRLILGLFCLIHGG